MNFSSRGVYRNSNRGAILLYMFHYVTIFQISFNQIGVIDTSVTAVMFFIFFRRFIRMRRLLQSNTLTSKTLPRQRHLRNGGG